MEQRLSLVTLGVGDVPRAERFYAALGWRKANDHAEVAFYQLNGLVLALWARSALAEDARLEDAGSPFGGIALAYNTRDRNEVDTVLAEAEQAGGTLLRRAAPTPWGGYSGYFADPDGHVWEVAFNPDWSISADGRTTLGR
ncbi:VOC family protein [Propylenella binzhouense]|uniref:VOC family protein n=1 Tax=Propylenella binzhouense TaxID=2555902 RepID=A0A964T2R5_9HYPH|nr:VOC family protein [Propylenella binzhouense]MYZ47353.1 VOC family protein [Propylenella binzhouense]